MASVVRRRGACLAALFLITLFVGPPLAAQSPPAEGPSLKAEEFYQNIQVFKGVPADQITPAMYFFSSSLGVGCGFCHAPGMDRSPDTPMKTIARKMVTMTTALNGGSFGGGRAVTCFTCHRGTAHPEVTPSAATLAAATPTVPPKAGVEIPSADALLDTHIAAVGGTASLGKIASFVAKGTATDIMGASTPLELSARAPGFRLVTRVGLKRDSPVGLLGDRGWMVDRVSRLRAMRIDEVDAAKLEDALWFPDRLKSLVTDLRTRGTQTIGGREAWVVSGRTRILPEVDLLFDKESGLLVRAIYYTDVTLGRYPTQFDIQAYTSVAGVQMPSRWSAAEVLDRRVTYQIDDVQVNVPVTAGSFEKPEQLPSNH